MSESGLHKRRRSFFSLSGRVSLLLMMAAILPLLVTVASSEFYSRPTLIDQANNAMASDAQTRVQLIDTYFNERVLDGETLSQVPTLQQYLIEGGDPTHAIYGLAAGQFRDKHYITWTALDPKGHVVLSYPPKVPPQKHGPYYAPPNLLQVADTGQNVISPVYYDPQTQKATVDLYTPIITASHTLIGVLRATLSIDYIWNIVQNDLGVNGTGSYAFIVDENGVRIADTNPDRRFTAIAPVPADAQQAIDTEERYGNAGPVPVKADEALTKIQQENNPPKTFQLQPYGANEQFVVARVAATTVPWTYLVLSPLNTVTAVANQQLFNMLLIAFAVLLLAAIGGLWVGRRITRPIMQSVEQLIENSKALNALATKQQSAASEQTWVVDSSQVGLQSVQYYTDATKVAASKLSEVGTDLAQRWHQLDVFTAKEALGQMITTAQYIENAAQYQNSSNQKLATAIKVTTQVAEQLATGAVSAKDAATQLDNVVNQLRNVVGK